MEIYKIANQIVCVLTKSYGSEQDEDICYNAAI